MFGHGDVASPEGGADQNNNIEECLLATAGRQFSICISMMKQCLIIRTMFCPNVIEYLNIATYQLA